MSALASESVEVRSPGRLLTSGCGVAVLAAPQLPPTRAESKYMDEFVNLGGTLVVAGTGPVTNEVLRSLGVNVTIVNATVVDLVERVNSSLELSVPVSLSGGLESLVLLNASPLRLGSGVTAIGNSSIFAFTLPLVKNLTPPYVLVAMRSMGLGRIIVIGSQYAFVNGVFDYNRFLLN
ncbi:MAG: DUF4350 domain-containing protein, partial [Acidilobus sp.]